MGDISPYDRCCARAGRGQQAGDHRLATARGRIVELEE